MYSMLAGLLTPQTLIAYVILCLIVAIFGRTRRLGFWGTLIISLAMTPVVTGFFLIVLKPRKARVPTRS